MIVKMDMKIKKKHCANRRGFTLMEFLVASSLFIRPKPANVDGAIEEPITPELDNIVQMARHLRSHRRSSYIRFQVASAVAIGRRSQGSI